MMRRWNTKTMARPSVCEVDSRVNGIVSRGREARVISGVVGRLRRRVAETSAGRALQRPAHGSSAGRRSQADLVIEDLDVLGDAQLTHGRAGRSRDHPNVAVMPPAKRTHHIAEVS